MMTVAFLFLTDDVDPFRLKISIKLKSLVIISTEEQRTVVDTDIQYLQIPGQCLVWMETNLSN